MGNGPPLQAVLAASGLQEGRRRVPGSPSPASGPRWPGPLPAPPPGGPPRAWALGPARPSALATLSPAPVNADFRDPEARGPGVPQPQGRGLLRGAGGAGAGALLCPRLCSHPRLSLLLCSPAAGGSQLCLPVSPRGLRPPPVRVAPKSPRHPVVQGADHRPRGLALIWGGGDQAHPPWKEEAARP